VPDRLREARAHAPIAPRTPAGDRGQVPSYIELGAPPSGVDFGPGYYIPKAWLAAACTDLLAREGRDAAEAIVRHWLGDPPDAPTVAAIAAGFRRKLAADAALRARGIGPHCGREGAVSGIAICCLVSYDAQWPGWADYPEEAPDA
jgi:hypothetical protein